MRDATSGWGAGVSGAGVDWAARGAEAVMRDSRVCWSKPRWQGLALGPRLGIPCANGSGRRRGGISSS
eukprot:1161585-Pelagomonas_calceolata.AAC.9